MDIGALRRGVYEWRMKFLSPLRWWRFALAVTHLWFVRSPAKSKSLTHVVVHCGGIGDLLMMSPVFRNLQNKFPDDHIALCTTNQAVATIYCEQPYIQEVFHMSAGFNRTFDSTTRGFVACWKCLYHYADLYIALRRCGTIGYWFHFAWNPAETSFGEAMILLLRPQRAIGLKCGKSQAFDTLALDGSQVETSAPRATLLERRGQQPNINIWITDHRDFARAVVKTFDPPQDLRYMFYLGTETKNVLDNRSLQPQRYLVVHAGGKIKHGMNKRWPEHHYREFMEKILSSTDLMIVLTGGHSDRELCERLKSGLDGSRVRDLSGRLSFCESGAVIRHCRICVTNDTSIVHLAEAVEAPYVISIYGPTDPLRLVRNHSRHTVVRGSEPCMPCHVTWSESCRERPCLAELSADTVFEACQAILEASE